MDPLTPPQITLPEGHTTVGFFPHVLLLAALLPTPLLLSEGVLNDGVLLGLTDRQWLWIALAVPIIHQIEVVVVWRAQLKWRALSRLFGKHDLTVWGAMFLPFLLARPLTILALGLADAGSAGLPRAVAVGLSVLLAIPSIAALYAVMRHFGIPRALGGDHFYERYRVMPFVRRGAFAWSDNAMYTLAFLGLWSIALATNSLAAIAAVLFQHAYIWVHWYCTEQPDIQVLHGS